MKKIWLVSATILATLLPAWSQTNGNTRDSRLEGTWKLVSGQPLPKGVRDIKMLLGGHFIFVAYEAETGKPLYTGGGTYVLKGNSYTEHVDFMSENISAGMIGQDQAFTVRMDGNIFTQTGTRSNGMPLEEIWKRAD